MSSPCHLRQSFQTFTKSAEEREGHGGVCEEVGVFAGDGLCNGEKMVSFSASVDAPQRVINCTSLVWALDGASGPATCDHGGGPLHHG